VVCQTGGELCPVFLGSDSNPAVKIHLSTSPQVDVPSLKCIFYMKITREGIFLRSGKGENGLAWLK
jgi:hypothetical protein